MASIDSAPSKLDVEILVHGTDEDMAKLLEIIATRSPSLCVPAAVSVEEYASKPRRRVTFSIAGPTDFMLEEAREWLNELLLDGRREITGTVTPRDAK